MKTTEQKNAEATIAMGDEIDRLEKALKLKKTTVEEKEILYHPTGHTPAFHRKVKD